jgi:hypothetical protein
MEKFRGVFVKLQRLIINKIKPRGVNVSPSKLSPAQGQSSKAYETLMRKSSKPWARSYLGFWSLAWLKRSSTQTR